ncbi:Hydroxyacylglutathione hydrolase GloB [Candidatus Kinetoplastibacterium sorsogonicusi]|uniref:Hydroxyacylglutathione hydrolase n=1 Tax=Candidatus Kinetoplastidibacterium kentomonadis TaxID=1576550 RepID=A0A3S7JAI6_9PROT|nr:hydroxyacylglutathione hydrolase [Candidatus Kinetoplastibacterium sorsogonicusi]AWD32679.1 Hydroxyacylglutathione hydrolase GloB [Candidatus Kinetoplastibacterium sorsogonicusi]
MNNQNINIIPIKAMKDNYIWAIIKNNMAIIIDPGIAEPVIKFLKAKKLKLIAILITHQHYDHINGIYELQYQYNPIIYGPRINNILVKYNFVKNNEIIYIEQINIHVKVIHTPGHTIEHVSYLISNNNDYLLFCGDTLFSAGCGKVFTGTMEQLFNSLKIFSLMPLNTKIFCAHEYTLKNLKWAIEVDKHNQLLIQYYNYILNFNDPNMTTIPSSLKLEMLINPFFRINNISIINSVKKYINKSINSPMSIFIELRKWKDNYK